MKVAVCISGIPRGNYMENVRKLKSCLPFDFFFHTWDHCKVNDELENVYYDKEPEILHSPKELNLNEEILSLGDEATFIKNLVERKMINNDDRTSTHAKRILQLLGHQLLLNRIPEEYDMIIRTRWDIEINTLIGWEKITREAYKKDKVLGYASISHHKNEFKILGDPWNFPTRNKKLLEASYMFLFDFLIMHKRDRFIDPYPLYEDGDLYISHIGWWQLLCDGDPQYHENYFGGVKKTS